MDSCAFIKRTSMPCAADMPCSTILHVYTCVVINAQQEIHASLGQAYLTSLKITQDRNQLKRWTQKSIM